MTVHAYDLGAHRTLCGVSGSSVADAGGYPDWHHAVTCEDCRSMLVEGYVQPSAALTEAGVALRSIAASGNEVMDPWSFVPCAQEHEPGRLCILPDGHAARAAQPDPGLEARVLALADEWECEPNPSEYHAAHCPACNRAATVRALVT